MRRRTLLLILSLTAAVCYLIDAWRLLRILFTRDIYSKDFVQFVLMGHALRAGRYLYEPLPSLAQQFDPNLGQWLNHPSAYPPIVALIGLPLSYLPYFWSVVTWLAFEFLCLVTAVVLVVRQFGGKRAPTSVLITALAFVAWHPIYLDLYLGQLMVPILLLLTLTWLALKTKKDVKAGLLLGTVVAIKLYAWPIVLFLFLSRRWEAALVAVALFLCANGLMMPLVGIETVISYYVSVGGNIAALYQNDILNFSSWVIGLQLFGVAGAVILTLAMLAFALALALRTATLESGFMIMLIASTILQPIAWAQYFVTLLPAFCFIAARRDFRLQDLLFVTLLIVLVVPVYHHFAYQNSAWARMPPFLFVVGLCGLTAWQEARASKLAAVSS